jgi:hypothetical protein
MFLEQYKTAAAEGAVVELKLRLLAGKIPALQQYTHQKRLEDIKMRSRGTLTLFRTKKRKH